MMTQERQNDPDVVVIGGGQAGLACGYYLRRTGLEYVILDAGEAPGGAWRHGWDSLRLFSPAQWSSLPGWIMPGGVRHYPHRDELLDYLARYEERYELPIRRPVRIDRVERIGPADGRGTAHSRPGAPRALRALATEGDSWAARAVISATGTWSRPHVPDHPGRDAFRGRQLHSATYSSPAPFAGQRVLVVGGGNSGAQIQAEVSRVADSTWVALEPPRFLPDDVDGRYLFEQATARWKARQRGETPAPATASLGDIVMVEPVRQARERGDLETVRPFSRLTPDGVVWPDGREEAVDAIIWCTGFRAALDHLRPLGVVDERGRVDVDGTRSIAEPALWLVGYGEWTGHASATLIAVGRSARQTVSEVADYLG